MSCDTAAYNSFWMINAFVAVIFLIAFVGESRQKYGFTADVMWYSLLKHYSDSIESHSNRRKFLVNSFFFGKCDRRRCLEAIYSHYWRHWNPTCLTTQSFFSSNAMIATYISNIFIYNNKMPESFVNVSMQIWIALMEINAWKMKL